jgi:hypothetical protein
MEKIVGDWSTEVFMEVDEAKDICKLGKGEECCAFLVSGAGGFECLRMGYPNNTSIFARLEEGTMNAKGEGGWPGCAWEEELAYEQDPAEGASSSPKSLNKTEVKPVTAK